MSDLALDHADILAIEPDPGARREVYAALQGAGAKRIRLATTLAHGQGLLEAHGAHLILVSDALQDGDWRTLVPKPSAEPDRAAAAPAVPATFAGDMAELLGETAGRAGRDKPVPLAVLLMTARPTRALVESALAEGVAGVLVRPLTAATLGVRLRAALKAKPKPQSWVLD